MSSIPSPADSVAAPRLLEQVRGRIRFKHYSIRTEQAYLDWIKRFIRFLGKHHPNDMGAREVLEFLTLMPVAGRVAASTRHQAKSALLFSSNLIRGGRGSRGWQELAGAFAGAGAPILSARLWFSGMPAGAERGCCMANPICP